MRKFVERFIPFLVLGIALVIGIVGIFLLSYVLIWGAILALILYVIAWVRSKFAAKPTKPKTAEKGRTIDHEP
jgi:hypothetical protein